MTSPQSIDPAQQRFLQALAKIAARKAAESQRNNVQHKISA